MRYERQERYKSNLIGKNLKRINIILPLSCLDVVKDIGAILRSEQSKESDVFRKDLIAFVEIYKHHNDLE